MSDYLKKRERERKLEKIRGKVRKSSNGNGNGGGAKKQAIVSKAQLKRIAKETGAGDFFHPNVMRAFNSRLESSGSRLLDGSVVFVTSEAFDKEGVERQYSVRHMIPYQRIRKVAGGYSKPGVMELPTRADADRVVERMIKAGKGDD